MAETWKPVVGFEAEYEVSDEGRVRSLDRRKPYHRIDHHSGRTIEVTRMHRGQMLRPGTAESGHQIVILGRGETRLVHHLVLEAFVGPRPAGTECCHYDDNPANNKLENLRWDTRSANMADYHRNRGRHQNGWGISRHGQA